MNEANRSAEIQMEDQSDEIRMKVVARIYNDFPTKFGIPRQSGLVEGLKSIIVFEKEYRDKNALRGIEQFSHLWLIWQFSMATRQTWSPTVRPPRLGGNRRVGVFATRSPFRPNPIGLTSVKLEGVFEDAEHGVVLEVSGADLMNGTPILDVKPYIPFSDCHSDALGGYTEQTIAYHLEVRFPPALLERVPEEKRVPLRGVLSQDPRPSYQEDPDRIYGLRFADMEVKFRVQNDVLEVVSVEKAER